MKGKGREREEEKGREKEEGRRRKGEGGREKEEGSRHHLYELVRSDVPHLYCSVSAA
jgi:hypothetical protein